MMPDPSRCSPASKCSHLLDRITSLGGHGHHAGEAVAYSDLPPPPSEAHAQFGPEAPALHLGWERGMAFVRLALLRDQDN
ncbi:hypothetical protein Celaphus_00017798 [Cervus elaphus hippelaphus]|uniref:Uncharacterized protein n=1 Tax=Cervus elaphus hippelaphus TaxID=46360 RepID=A0A212C6Y7_CEREH|nr:hypothetical protein Celaphus_00017798 [Cervus elaphus hippelaphus]